MEENVALDSSKQKKFDKSIKGIKKLLKVNDKTKSKKEKGTVRIGKVKKLKLKERGLVYLSHIPHGFYEHQMTEYFKQFGVVTNARVIRSKRTGMSKGCAFVEFKDPNVAQIVSETMNNYLMGKRLIKAALVPPEKQRRFAKRKNWNAQNNPGNDLKQKMKKTHNSLKDDNEELKIARKLLLNLSKTKKKLRELDIDYDFFTPVDIPEALLDLVKVKQVEDSKPKSETKKEINDTVKEEDTVQNVSKKNKKKKSEIDVKDSIAQKRDITPSDKKKILVKTPKESIKDLKASKANKTKEQDGKVGKIVKNVTQEEKKKQLKKAGVDKPPEDFLSLQNDSDEESDSSMGFDSDEYDKIMEQDESDVQSNDETDEDLDEEVTSEEDESIEDDSPPTKKGKRLTPQQVQQAKKQKGNKPPQAMKVIPTLVQAPQAKKQDKKEKGKLPLQPTKRMSPKEAKQLKKPKFEKKGNKKSLNKVIKKK